jgi:hypothetical protein
VVTPIIDNLTTGESIYTQSVSLAAGDQLVIYPFETSDALFEIPTGRKRIELNGVNRPDLVDARLTRWWKLAPGENILRLRGSGMAGGQTRLDLRFRDARI